MSVNLTSQDTNDALILTLYEVLNKPTNQESVGLLAPIRG